MADLRSALQCEQGLCVIGDDDRGGTTGRRPGIAHGDVADRGPFRSRRARLARWPLRHAGPGGAVRRRTAAELRRRPARRRQDAGRADAARRPLRRLAEIEHVLVAIGEQLGQYIPRKQAERVLAHSEARFRSLDRAVVRLVLGVRSSPPFHQLRRPQPARLSARRLAQCVLRARRVGAAATWCARVPTGAAHRALLQRRERFIDFQFAVRRPTASCAGPAPAASRLRCRRPVRRLPRRVARHHRAPPGRGLDPPPGHARHADRPAQPRAVCRASSARRCAPPAATGASSRCCSSTSTASRSSTTRSATMPATCCWREMATSLQRLPARRATWWRAWAATSSWCCCSHLPAVDEAAAVARKLLSRGDQAAVAQRPGVPRHAPASASASSPTTPATRPR